MYHHSSFSLLSLQNFVFFFIIKNSNAKRLRSSFDIRSLSLLKILFKVWTTTDRPVHNRRPNVLDLFIIIFFRLLLNRPAISQSVSESNQDNILFIVIKRVLPLSRLPNVRARVLSIVCVWYRKLIWLSWSRIVVVVVCVVGYRMNFCSLLELVDSWYCCNILSIRLFLVFRSTSFFFERTKKFGTMKANKTHFLEQLLLWCVDELLGRRGEYI